MSNRISKTFIFSESKRQTLFVFLFFFGFFCNSVIAQVNEDFESGTASGWTTSGTASTGTFVVANPTAESSGGIITQLEDDNTPFPGVNAYFTATNTSVGNADVDGGTSITTSPIYNITAPSQLSIWYFFGQRDNGDDAGDFFLLEYSINGGSTFTSLVSIGDVTTNASWTEATAAIPAGSNVVIRVTVSDGASAGDIIEGGIDDLTITTLGPVITIDDVVVNEGDGTATFTATHTGANATGPFTVNYQTTDGTAIAPGDYTSNSGTLNFSGTLGDSELITITINDDVILESDETFSIGFTTSSDGTVDLSDTATATIQDNENDPNNPRPYEEREAMNLMGNFKMLGNTNLECVSGCPVTPTSNNPSVVMGYVDVDTNGTTVNSSSATLSLPAGATVQWAGLYWGGVYNSTFGGITNPTGLNIDQVQFLVPGGTYTTVNAETRNIETSSFAGWNSFMSFAEVTSLVQTGGAGDYFTADIALATGSAFTGPYGGWTMVVIYDDPTETTRNVSVWDGFDFFGFGANDSFTVTGLLTPSTGTFESHAGYFGFDGDANFTGDFVTIEGTTLSNVLNPGTNTLNGTISEFGVDLGTRNPSYTYSWGIDIDIFDASGLVPNNATDMDVVLGSSSEGIWGGVFVTSNEIAFPTVATSSFSPSTIFLGQESTVTITIENPSNGVSLTNLTLTNNLPAGMTIASTPNATSSCGGSSTAITGSSSFSISGVSLPAGTSCSFTFDVTTSSDGVFTNTISPSNITNDQNIPLSGSTSTNLTVLPQPDSDNDGISDDVDLDDDNDGILDAVECPNGGTVLWVTNGTPGTEEQNTIDKLTALGYTVTVVDDNVAEDANNYAVTFVYEDVFSGDAFANVANLATTTRGVITSEPALHDEILGASTGGNGTSTEVQIIDNSHPITTGLPLGNYDIGDAEYFGNGLTTGTILARDPSSGEGSIVVWEPGDAMEVGTAPGRRVIVPHSNGNGGFNAAGEDLLVNAIIWTSQIDTDRDGIVDCLDTDSDGDGCSDADEAYADASTDSDDNGRFGSGAPPVNGDGTVSAASYTTPADENTNGIPDYLEVVPSATIVTQPIDAQTCPGCGTSFTVSVSNANVFQWQRFNGSSWVDLTDTGIYSGSGTATLTITNPTSVENGEQYRVLVSNNALVCEEVISNQVTLTLAVSTVITNRRITYRINRN